MANAMNGLVCLPLPLTAAAVVELFSSALAGSLITCVATCCAVTLARRPKATAWFSPVVRKLGVVVKVCVSASA